MGSPATHASLLLETAWLIQSSTAYLLCLRCLGDTDTGGRMSDHSAGHRFSIPLESARGIAALIVATFHVSLTPLRVTPNFRDVVIDPNIEHGIWYAASYVFRLMTEGTGATVSPPFFSFMFSVGSC